MISGKASWKKKLEIPLTQSIFKGKLESGLKRMKFLSNFRGYSQKFLNNLDVSFVMHIAVIGVPSLSHR